jgi:RNA polymerase sigma-70 factor (ECF subfamily)
MNDSPANLKADATPPLEHDRHAQFLMLFLASEKEIFRYISALAPSMGDAQDILQQTALSLWKKFEDYDPQQPFTPWACRFALLEAKEFLRRNRKWQAFLAEGLLETLAERRQALQGELDARLVFLPGCLEKLPADHLELIEGYYYRRETIENLSTNVGRTVEAIYKSLQRIRKQLLDCISLSLQNAEGSA